LKGFSSSSDITSPQVSCSLGLCPSCSFCQSCSFCLPYFLCLCVYRPVSTPTSGHPCTTYTGDLFELVRGDLAGLQGVQPGMLRYLVEDLLGQEFDHQDLADCAEEVLVVCLSCVCRVSVVCLSWVSCVPAIRLPCICRALLSSRLCMSMCLVQYVKVFVPRLKCQIMMTSTTTWWSVCMCARVVCALTYTCTHVHVCVFRKQQRRETPCFVVALFLVWLSFSHTPTLACAASAAKHSANKTDEKNR